MSLLSKDCISWEISVRRQVCKEPTGTVDQKLIITESNKSRIVSQNGILPILYKLWNPSLVPVAIPVLCQICSDHGRFAAAFGTDAI